MSNSSVCVIALVILDNTTRSGGVGHKNQGSVRMCVCVCVKMSKGVGMVIPKSIAV